MKVLLLFLLSLTAQAIAIKPALRECETNADCRMININCGRPGAVNKAYEKYTESPGGCDASMDYSAQAKHYSVVCKARQCSLVENKSSK